MARDLSGTEREQAAQAEEAWGRTRRVAEHGQESPPHPRDFQVTTARALLDVDRRLRALEGRR